MLMLKTAAGTPSMYRKHFEGNDQLNDSLLRRFVSAEATSMLRPVVLCGPSGSGKSTILKRVFADHPDCFAFSVSHTTRNPRAGEVEGKDYYFVARDQMLKAIANNEFLEHAEFSSNLYGTSRKAVEEIQKTGKICILDVDIQGVRNIKQSALNAKYVLLKPPDFEELERRLRGRGTETDESLQKRLNQAIADMEEIAAEPTLFDYVIVNDDLDVACMQFSAILASDLAMVKAAKEK